MRSQNRRLVVVTQIGGRENYSIVSSLVAAGANVLLVTDIYPIPLLRDLYCGRLSNRNVRVLSFSLLFAFLRILRGRQTWSRVVEYNAAFDYFA